MKNTGMLLGGILAGAIIGTATALLLAPQKGSETRDQLKEKLNDLEVELNKTKEKLKVKGGEIRDELKEKIHAIELRIEKLLNEHKSSMEPTTGEN